MSRRMKWMLGGAFLAAALVASTGPARGAIPEIPPGMTNEPVSQHVLDEFALLFPQQDNSGQFYMDPSYSRTLVLSEPGQIKVTFIKDGAGYLNTLGYYVVPPSGFSGLINSDVNTNPSSLGVDWNEFAMNTGVTEYGLVFPNASGSGLGGALVQGDTVAIGNGTIFPAGTRIGFILGQDSWDPVASDVKPVLPSDPFPQAFYTDEFLNPEALPDTPSTAQGGIIRHFGMVFSNDGTRETLLMGVEDLNRLGGAYNPLGRIPDNDFDDLLFTVNGPISGSDIPTAPGPVVGTGLGILMTLSGAAMARRQRRKRALRA